MTHNETEFLKNERPNEYCARISVKCQVHLDIRASSLEEAKSKVAAMIDADDFDDLFDAMSPDDILRADIDRVYKAQSLFLVTREGRPMQVSHVEEGDEPRQPDERGF